MIYARLVITLAQFLSQQFCLMQIDKPVSHALFSCFPKGNRIFRTDKAPLSIFLQVRNLAKAITRLRRHWKRPQITSDKRPGRRVRRQFDNSRDLWHDFLRLDIVASHGLRGRQAESTFFRSFSVLRLICVAFRPTINLPCRCCGYYEEDTCVLVKQEW